MILYTMMPHEYIFPTDHEMFLSQKVIPCESGQLIVEQVNPDQYRIVRLISSNANAFLNEKYTPGTIIQASPRT